VTKIVIDANCLAWDWGGIPKYVDRIVRELARDETLDLVLLANAGGPFAEIEGVRQRWRRIRGGAAWRNGFVLPVLARTRPDVFWAPQGLTPVHVPVPSVVTLHDLAPLLFPGTKPWRETLAYRSNMRRSARRADRVLAVAATTAAGARRRGGRRGGRLRVVPKGGDAPVTPGDRAAAAAAVRARCGLDGRFVLHVGALDPRKGLDVLFDAAERAWAAGDGWRLALAGSPGFGSEAQLARLEGAPWCALLGRVTDAELLQLYRAADVLAAPAIYEGFGIAPVEAMACGTPSVVAANSGGLEEVSGSAAVVVSERTPEAWRAGIAEAYRRRAELAAAGRALARRYRWDDVAARTRQVLLETA
jgi:glycosyltransferase involved in cell wall biosynthesis